MGFMDERFQAVTLEADKDLSSKQYHFVKLDGAEVTDCSVEGELAFGVLRNAPDDGEAATVAISGITNVVAGEAISAGDKVTTKADGRAQTATATDAILGWAVRGASGDGHVCSVAFFGYLGEEE